MKRARITIFIIFITNTHVFSQWLENGGPQGGYLNQIVNINASLFVSAGNGGVYKSTNNGEDWIRSSKGLPLNEQVQDLVESMGVLYASMSGAGIYISTNEGESWTPINSGINSLTFYSLGVHSSNIFAGNGNGGVFHSSDNGKTWFDKSSGIDDIQVQDFAFFKSMVYAGGKSLFRSSTNGISWEKVEVTGLDPNGVRSMVATENTMYIGDNAGVFTSHDGVNWTKSSINTQGTVVSMGYSADSVYFTTGSGRLFYTKDEGLTWALIQNNETTNFANGVILFKGKMIMSTSEGLYSSSNGGMSWFPSNDGIRALQINSLVASPSNIFAGTERQGLFRSEISGSWTKINTGLDAANSTSVHDICIVKDQLIIATGAGVYSSFNNGNSWNRKLDPGMNQSVGALDFDEGILACGVNGVGIYISSDTAKTWSLAGIQGLNTETSYESIMVEGDTIAVSTAGGEIFVSKDFGLTWSGISISGGYYQTNDIQLENEKLYVGTTRGLFVSENLGEDWVAINNEEKHISSFVMGGDKIFVGTSDGVYVTSRTRNAWYDVSDEVGHQAINKIILSGDSIYAGTFATSVWRRAVAEANIPPLVKAATRALVTAEDTPFTVQLSDLIIDDDNGAGDRSLTIVADDNYVFENNKITPVQNYHGALTVKLFVNDGMDDSPVFDLPVVVTPVNDAPAITGQKNALSTAQETEKAIQLSDLIVEDVDNNYPTDFSIAIKEGKDYTTLDNVITPKEGYVGVLKVPAAVNDGELNSNEFLISIDVTQILGFENPFIKENFSVYPNPVINNLNISANKIYKSFCIKLFGADGKLIYATNTKTDRTQTFNIGSFPDGVYLLQIISGNKSGTVKLIKE